jgi:hypothetical protein
MNVLEEPISNGISVVTVSMNRTYHLIQSIPTWKRALRNHTNEIIVLDWGSEIPIEDIWGGIKLLRVFYKYWHLSLAYNIAVQCSKYNKILKLDADDILKEDFFEKNVLDVGTFLTGDWKLARNENETHLNGIVFIDRELFFKIAGYNEMIQTYGYDDTDLYERASEHSVKKSIDLNTVSHIAHSDNLRGNNLHKSILDNMLLSRMYKWKGPMTPIIKVKKGNPIRLKIRNTYKFIAKNISNVYDAFDFTMRFISREILSPRLFPLQIRKKIYIEAINGLCNRLRSFASAAVIACAINRDLILIWESSHHCEAFFKDLFDTKPFDKLPINFTILNEKPNDVRIKKYILTNDQIIPTTFFSKYLDGPSNGLPSDFLPSKLLDIPSYFPRYRKDVKELYEAEDIYLITADVIINKYTNWSKESNFLRKYIKPEKSLLSKIDTFKAIRNNIGVHIRMGQKASYDDTDGWDESAKKSWEKWRKHSHMSNFVRKMKEILNSDPSQRFYLAADNQYIYDELLKHFDCIDFFRRDLFDRSVNQIKTAVIDLFLLSKTKQLLGSNWSTFTEIAHKLSGKRTYLSGIDF